MIEKILVIIVCHLIGDYILQTDYIARTKGDNLYHLFIHCILYTLPFSILFGFSWKCVVVFLTHICIDTLKAKYKKINYVQDQVLHYIIAFILFI